MDFLKQFRGIFPEWRTRLLILIGLFLLIAGLGTVNAYLRTRTGKEGRSGQAILAVGTASQTPSEAELPAATATPLPTATPSPLPAATSTATPFPDARLDMANRLQRLGDYAGARSQLAALLATDMADRDIRLQAGYQLAKSYLADDHYNEALATLNQLDAEFALTLSANAPTSTSMTVTTTAQQELRTKSQFLRGVALAGLGQHTQAISAYKTFLEAYPWMATIVQPKIAQAYQAQGNISQAAAAYRLAVGATGDTVDRVSLLESLAQLYAGAGQYTDAVATYDEILQVAKNSGYRAQIQYLAGQVLATAGDETGAIERWRAATAEAPAGNAAYQALVELVNRQVPFDQYQRGVIDLAAQAWLPAATAFKAYLDSVAPTDGRAGAALHGMGQAYLGAENYATAIDTLNRVVTQYPKCECVGQAWLDEARAQAAMGDTVSARRTYRTFAREFPNNPLAPEALWRSGLSALRDNNQSEAAADFLVLADGFPNSNRAPAALYAIGLGAYQNNLYSQTVAMYTRLQQHYPDYKWDAVSYWLGRTYQASGEIDKARAEWQKLVKRAPDIYYGILAAESLRNFNFVGGSLVNHVADVAGPPSALIGDDGSQAFAEKWLADWLKIDASTLAMLPPAIAQDPDLAVGRMLLDVGERDTALPILERVYDRNKDNSQALYALSLEFERLNTYRLSLITMARLLQFSPAGSVENAPIFLQERAYPRRFTDLIEQEAAANQENSLLLFSLIRQESLFEEGARSVAAAQGLAQIVPATGAWVAEQIGYAGYDNSLIYRPFINVKFGAYYLRWTYKYLDQNWVSALVGYNAGPGNSEYWRKIAGADDTIFVELLELNEPRTYVQAIITNLYHYTRLYGKP